MPLRSTGSAGSTCWSTTPASPTPGRPRTKTPEQLQDLVDTNLTGLFALTQLVGRHMLARGSGVIVNIASPSATVSLDRYGLAGYAATKAGVVALTRELACQWGGRGVRVNALAPSFFPTATTGWLQDPDQVAWICAHAPLGRPPRPDELDGPLLFLASDASSYVTGQTLLRRRRLDLPLSPSHRLGT